MNGPRRHRLVWLNAQGWAGVQAGLQAQDTGVTPAPIARDCVATWAERRWPLVVTRQRSAQQWAQGTLCVGLPAPTRWQRLRLGLTVAHADIAGFDEFPAAETTARLLGRSTRPHWNRLFQALAQAGHQPRVYGSYGWQALTGQNHVRPGSDLDLLLSVASPEAADHAAALLAAQAALDMGPRLDGELMFANGAALPWREWLAWRRGQVRSVIVKTSTSVCLADGCFWANGPSLVEAGVAA